MVADSLSGCHAAQEQPERGRTHKGEQQHHRTQEHSGLHVGHVRRQRGAETFTDINETRRNVSQAHR
jgi:hypothetical protein